jgi:CBS domain-containing protein
MRIHEIMTPAPHTCHAADTLDRAAQAMWEHDIGALPVVDDAGTVIGMITDRDIAMATFLRGAPPHALSVASAMAAHVVSCRPHDALGTARQLMAEHQLRRLPVVDGAGKLRGIVSLADLALEAHHTRSMGSAELRPADVGQIVAAVCAPRGGRRARAA